MEFNDLGLPKFDEVKVFEVELPMDLHVASDEKQFREATKILKKAIQENTISTEYFNKNSLQEIWGTNPKIKGFTWHHHEITGKLYLVPEVIHADTKHTGGKVLWSDGKR
nr:HNH endonuclease [Macrococcus canis]